MTNGDRSNGERIVWGIGTTRTFRAHWALAELGLDYETRPIGSRTGETQTAEYLALNPRGKIPTLVDGDLVLAESAAIVNYLADNYRRERPISPKSGTRERALYDQWCLFMMTELDAHTLYVIRKHRDLAAIYGEAPAAIDAAIDGFRRQVQVLADEIKDGRRYLLGDSFSGTDVLLASILDWAQLYEIEVPDPLPEMRGRLRSRETYRPTMELNYPDLDLEPLLG